MRKKVIAFDLDDTLNVAKTPITPTMASLLVRLLDEYEVAAISGQKYEQFVVQIVDELRRCNVKDEQLTRLHLFVTQGTRYYRFENGDWNLVYAIDLSDEDVRTMTGAVEQAAKELGYWEEDKLTEGDEIIENRISQVTFSALGQTAGVEAKYAWDPDTKKRVAIATRAKELTPNFEYEIAGTTSINMTLPGTNKSLGMSKLLEHLDVQKTDVLYFGDMTRPGGNDYPVVEMGFDTITVEKWQDTAYALRGILAVS